MSQHDRTTDFALQTPTVSIDTDGDGQSDAAELHAGTDPYAADAAPTLENPLVTHEARPTRDPAAFDHNVEVEIDRSAANPFAGLTDPLGVIGNLAPDHAGVGTLLGQNVDTNANSPDLLGFLPHGSDAAGHAGAPNLPFAPDSSLYADHPLSPLEAADEILGRGGILGAAVNTIIDTAGTIATAGTGADSLAASLTNSAFHGVSDALDDAGHQFHTADEKAVAPPPPATPTPPPPPAAPPPPEPEPVVDPTYDPYDTTNPDHDNPVDPRNLTEADFELVASIRGGDGVNPDDPANNGPTDNDFSTVRPFDPVTDDGGGDPDAGDLRSSPQGPPRITNQAGPETRPDLVDAGAPVGDDDGSGGGETFGYADSISSTDGDDDSATAGSGIGGLDAPAMPAGFELGVFDTTNSFEGADMSDDTAGIGGGAHGFSFDDPGNTDDGVLGDIG